MSQVFKKFRQDILSILLLTSGLFLALALTGYNPMDPSLNSIGQGLKAANYCGIVGSFVSDLLYQAFGVSAWVLVIGILRMAYSSFEGEEINLKNIRMLWGALLLVNSAALFSLYMPEKKIFQGQIFLGGLLGLGVSQAMVRAFNFGGVQLVLWASLVMLAVFYSERRLKDLAKIPAEVYELFSSSKILKRVLALAKNSGVKAKTKIKPVDKSEEKPSKAIGIFSMPSRQMEFQDALIQKPAKNGLAADEANGDENLEAFEDEVVEEGDIEKALPKRKVIVRAKIPKKVANWDMPKLSMLEDPPASRLKIDEKEIRRKADLLVDKLKQFSIEGQIVGCRPGPAVTLYEFKPNADVKLSKITELADDLSLALSSESLRIIAPIPGRDVVGIETSNAQRETVYLKDLLAEEKFWAEDFKLPMALGKQADGNPKIVDLRKMPHLMVAGTTGSGKSVFTVSAICGFLFRHSPKTLRLILIDPKQVDLAAFSNIPHLIMPPVVDPKKAVSALRWAVKEMEKRYKSLSKFKARNIEEFNAAIENLTPEQVEEHQKINEELEAANKKPETYYCTAQPYIVIAIEEFADLMAVDKQNVEQLVVRLAQMARAAGMHLYLAMQSPRKEVVTGLIKTNIPGRIGFKVASKLDSRVILDEGGAERLLAQGDMLFLAPGLSKPARHHGPFLKEAEINNIAKWWSDQAEPEFDPLALKALDGFSGEGSDGSSGGAGNDGFGETEYDDRYDEILSWTSEQREVSASLIQRRFRLGYPRAARIIEIFEKEGVVGPSNGSKPRQVTISSYKDAE